MGNCSDRNWRKLGCVVQDKREREGHELFPRDDFETPSCVRHFFPVKIGIRNEGTPRKVPTPHTLPEMRHEFLLFCLYFFSSSLTFSSIHVFTDYTYPQTRAYHPSCSRHRHMNVAVSRFAGFLERSLVGDDSLQKPPHETTFTKCTRTTYI